MAATREESATPWMASLDIKPYVAECDSFPEARCAWLDEASVRKGVVHADGRFEQP